MRADGPGQIVVLNGTPRSGKSSIATAIQRTFDGVWMNLGVDRFKAMTPQQYQPGIGLRPGGERPDLEPLVIRLYHAMYESIAAHSRVGVNVVVDVGHHDAYSTPLGILPGCARLLDGLPVLFVGVRCPLEVVIARRRATWEPILPTARSLRQCDCGSGPSMSQASTTSRSTPRCSARRSAPTRSVGGWRAAQPHLRSRGSPR